MDYTIGWYGLWTIQEIGMDYGLLLMDYVSNHTGVKLPGTSDGLIPYFWRPVFTDKD